MQNPELAVALHPMYCDFCGIYHNLGVSPAMEAGIVNKPWNINDVLDLFEGKGDRQVFVDLWFNVIDYSIGLRV